MSAPIRPTDLAALNQRLAGLDPAGRLRAIRDAVPGRIVLTTSFGAEDQALTHLVAESGLDIELATLDTGRLFPETHDVWAETERRYGLRVRALHPDADALEHLVASQGINGFREDQAARHACCGVRKVEPLGRALSGVAGWITGLRADQSASRTWAYFAQVDPARDLLKFNPLLDWTRQAVADFLAAHDVPRNALHARGFASIGCAPCTRAIGPDEPERAGRWWWEQESHQECGLHLGPDGRLVRAPAPERATS